MTPIPATQARPIYYTVIPVECQADIDEMMKLVSHEMIEVITDEMPGAFWYTRHNNASVTVDAEAADICEHEVTADGNDWVRKPGGERIREEEVGLLPWKDTRGATRTMSLAAYWSNKDNMCIAPTREEPRPAPPCSDSCGCTCGPKEICHAGQCEPATCGIVCDVQFAQALDACSDHPTCICEAEQNLSCCNQACRGQPCRRRRCE